MKTVNQDYVALDQGRIVTSSSAIREHAAALLVSESDKRIDDESDDNHRDKDIPHFVGGLPGGGPSIIGPKYYYSDEDESFTGTSTNGDALNFVNDTGNFDWKNFAFIRDGDDLHIYADNGYTATVTNHFLSNVARVETLNFFGTSDLDLTLSNLLVMTTNHNQVPIYQPLYGTSGDDFMLGGIGQQAYEDDPSLLNGSTVVSGGAGNDTIIANYVYSVYGGDGNDTIYSSRVEAGDGDDIIYVSEARTINNSMFAHGDAGNDVIYGTDIDDVAVFGDDGNDIIYGYGGNDALYGNNGDDIIYGGDGDDAINGDADGDFDGNDILYGGNGNDSITTGDGLDIAYGGDGDDLISANISVIEGHTGNKELYGEAGNDNVIDGAGDDYLSGGDGDDQLKMYTGGNDVAYGGIGNDRIYIKAGYGETDYAYGENGDDTLQFGGRQTYTTGYLYSRGEGFLYGGTGNDLYQAEKPSQPWDFGNWLIYDDSGYSDTLQLMGSDSSDWTITVDGDDLVFVFDGYTGEIRLEDHFVFNHHIETIEFLDTTISTIETLTSGADNYTATAITSPFGTTANIVNGDYGDDTIHGGDGNDVLYGGGDNDVLYGDAGGDYLDGGQGNDILYGGAGADTLHGGGDADTFVFESATAFDAVDTITDFSLAAGDALDISDILDGFYDPLTDALTDFVQITENGTDSILSVDFDGGGDNFVQIASILGVTGLTDEDALETAGHLIT